MATVQNGKTVIKPMTKDTKYKKVWLVMTSACRLVVRYLTYIYLLNPVHYIRDKERSLYYVNSEGKNQFKPRLWERLVNLMSSEIQRRHAMLLWIKSKVPERNVDDFCSSWQDGIALCALLEAVLPGSCPGYHNLKTHNRVNNCRLGIKLAHEYLMLPKEMLSPEEMAIADKRTDKKIFMFISTLKWASEKKSKQRIRLSLVPPRSCCTVQGSGLKAGVVGRKMKFTVTISNVFGMFDLFLQMKGPRNEVYSEKIVSLHQSSDSILNNRNKVVKRVSAEHKVSPGDARVLAYLEDGHGNTYVRWKNVIQYGAHAVYNAFDFTCTCNKEGSFTMSFTPVSAGIHTLSIRWQEKHVDGSPFKVKVYKLSDVSRRNLLETKDKRMLFDSLSMSLDCQAPPSEQSKQEDKTIQRIRKQYTITKRRILKKVITKNGEEIIITETPTPPFSRQSSITDISDYTDEDSCRRSRSSSPALLRAANDLVKRSRSSSPGRKNSKDPKMTSILERSILRPYSASCSSIAEIDSFTSTDSKLVDRCNRNSTGSKVWDKFADMCWTSTANREFRIHRQSSEGTESKIENQQNKTGVGWRLQKVSFLKKSLSDPNLDDRIKKSLIVNSTKSNHFDGGGSKCQTNMPLLKMLKSASLKKACFYISEKAIDQSQSLVSNDSQTESMSLIPQVTYTEEEHKTATEEEENAKHHDHDYHDDGGYYTGDIHSRANASSTPLNNNRQDSNKMAPPILELSARNDTETSTTDDKYVKITNLRETSAIKHVEDWLNQNQRHSVKRILYDTASSIKIKAGRTMSNEAIEKLRKVEMRRTKSCDTKRSTFRKQRSIYPDEEDESHDEMDISSNDQLNPRSHDQHDRFQSIYKGHNVEESCNVSIVVPKVKCDKGMVVSASEILQETKWDRISNMGTILRRRICVGAETHHAAEKDEREEIKDEINLMPEGIVPTPSRSFSIDMGSRERKVRAWIDRHPLVRFEGPIRQSTVETMDSGMGDDNGMLSTRRASLYSNFRFSDDNHHQTVCRRPYKGKIPLDPKLIQGSVNSNDDNNNTIESSNPSTDSTDSMDSTEDEKDESRDLQGNQSAWLHSSVQTGSGNNAVMISSYPAQTESNNDAVMLTSLPVQSCSGYDPVMLTSLLDSNTISSHESGMTVLTSISRTSTLSSESLGDTYKFGINKENREVLLNHIDTFRHLDEFKQQNDSNTHSSLSPLNECAGYAASCDSSWSDERQMSQEDVSSQTYISSLEVPYFLQINDVRVRNHQLEYVDDVELDGFELKNRIDERFSEDMVCRANGQGLEEGQVGVKNNFQVWTSDPDNGSLSVTIYGPKNHSVLETCVIYTGDNLYEVIYEVKHPGIYIISVKWSEENVPNSPFTCRVTY